MKRAVNDAEWHIEARTAFLCVGIALGAAVGLWVEWPWGLIAGLPVVVGGLAAWWPRRRSTRARTLRFALGSLITLGAVGASLFVCLVVLMGTAFSGNESRDVRDYASLREHALQPHMIAHFPTQIPARATRVSLSHFSGLSQGANWLQLRMHLPREEVAAMITELESTAGARKDPALPSHGVTDFPIGIIAGEAHTEKLPERFHLYALNPPLTDKDWNHPDRWGVAIDEEACEVLYYAEAG